MICLYLTEHGKGDVTSMIRLYKSVTSNFLEDFLFDEANHHILERPIVKGTEGGFWPTVIKGLTSRWESLEDGPSPTEPSDEMQP